MPIESGGRPSKGKPLCIADTLRFTIPSRCRDFFLAKPHYKCSYEHMLHLIDHPPVPESKLEAATCLRRVLRKRNSLPGVGHGEFLKAWSSIAYLMPGLHPDESGHEDGGWPVGWRCLADEAFRRSDIGELADGELYPYACAQKAMGLPWRPLPDGTLGY